MWIGRNTGQDDKCFHVALSVAEDLGMLTKPVATRATAATRAGCVQRGLHRKTSFSRRGSISAAEDDQRPSIL